MVDPVFPSRRFILGTYRNGRAAPFGSYIGTLGSRCGHTLFLCAYRFLFGVHNEGWAYQSGMREYESDELLASLALYGTLSFLLAILLVSIVGSSFERMDLVLKMGECTCWTFSLGLVQLELGMILYARCSLSA